jgi:hypothetical protein
MKILVTMSVVLLLALISYTGADMSSGQCISGSSPYIRNTSTSKSLYELNKFAIRADTPPPGDDPDWVAARCRGEKLLYFMKLTDQEDASKVLQWPYVQSPWDGDLKKDLETWGYSEKELPYNCDFEYTEFTNVMEALKIDTSSVEDGGRNHCFKFMHYNGLKVEKNEDGTFPNQYIQKYKVGDKTYRVSKI